MPSVIGWSPLLHRPARAGDARAQGRSTWREIMAAARAGDAATIAALADFALERECRPVFELLLGWSADLREFLSARGTGAGELDRCAERLAALLAVPGGAPFDPHRGWAAVEASVARIRRAAASSDWAGAASAARDACDTWRSVHDRVVDLSFGWMSEVVARLGETAVPEMFEAIARPHFEEFFSLADPALRSWEDSGAEAVLYDTLEAMRVHLSTTGRDGVPLDVADRGDYWELTFDPCGSGGRAIRGDDREGTPSRMDEPYRFARIEGAYPWTDGVAGMCVYCNHCQQVYEQWTIDAAGLPFLVVDPPVGNDPRDAGRARRCRYRIYKRADAVPDHVYLRCGRERPE